MSANLLVDLGNTCQLGFGALSAPAFAASAAGIGQIQDMINADTFTNVMIQGVPNAAGSSGQLRVFVQTSDGTTSGSFTDPTSGFNVFPTVFESGGIIRINSGGLGGTNGQGTFGDFISGHAFLSGFVEAGGFLRPHRYARIGYLSGDFYYGTLALTLVGQLRTTGSGGGFTFSPTSGVVNV